MKTRILLDTNFLMMPYKNRIDIFQEIDRLMADKPGYELSVTQSVRCELERLAQEARGEDKVAAGLGLQLLEDKKVKVIEAEGALGADAQIIALAGGNRAATVVCTNDRALKKRLREMGVSVITMREKDHLDYV